MSKVKDIEDDIKYLEDLGLEAEEILESILRDYNGYATNKDIKTAFKNCDYDVTL